MKGVELYGRVRYAVQIEGLSRREAARRFGIDPRTVAKMMVFSVPPGYQRKQPPARPKLDPFIGIIDGILEEDKSRPTKQRHTSKRIFERLRDEHGFAGGLTIVKDYVAAAVVIVSTAVVSVFMAWPDPGWARSGCADRDTQTGMNQCSAADVDKANGAIQAIYNRLRSELDPEASKRLKDAERAWITYRDAWCTYETMSVEKGSMYPSVLAMLGASGRRADRPSHLSAHLSRPNRRLQEHSRTFWLTRRASPTAAAVHPCWKS